MAASTTQTQTAQIESKTALKKKKAKAALDASAAPVASVSTSDASQPRGTAESSNGDVYESPYIKELYKNIRNVNKKIANASRVDNVIADNPGKSLDELVAAKKINADQKAQILKKPALQATLLQYEEQIAQYKKFDQEYKARAQVEKAEVERTLTKQLVKEKEDAVAATKAEAEATIEKEKRENLLLVSRFLRLAAQRRADETADPNVDENMALEALLFLFYDGEEKAVQSMLKYIQGSDEKVTSINGEFLTTSYAQIKAASGAYAPPAAAVEVEAEPVQAYPSPAVETMDYPVQSDPTMANAGLTELNDAPLSNGHTEDVTSATGVLQSEIGGGNAVAEANWDHSANEMSTSQEWVNVTPRDAVETDTGVTATFAAPAQTQSWADEQPDSPPPAADSAPATQNGDGFEQVNRSRGGRDGPFRGRSARGSGDFRGGARGRGDFRGRGRGGPRGGGANRGRRSDES